MPRTNAGWSVAVDSWNHNGCEELNVERSAGGAWLYQPVMEVPGRTWDAPLLRG